MAGNGFTSPFPTSHDTLGGSSLNTPSFMPSSPPRLMNSFQESILHSKKPSSTHSLAANTARRRRMRSLKTTTSSPEPSDGSDSEANLADYTFDMSRLSDHHSDHDEGERDEAHEGNSPKEKHVSFSDFGGPRDFTLNMVELVRGTGALTNSDEDNASKSEPAQTQEEMRQNTVVADHTINDYSEMDTPLDMSTPAHVRPRRNIITRSNAPLDKIDEPSPIQSPPSKWPPPNPDLAEAPVERELREEMKRLQEELHEKDERIEANRKMVLESASASQQIKHLQSELQKKNAALKEKDAQLSILAGQDEEIENLRIQLQQKDEQLEQHEADPSTIRSLRQELEQLQRKGSQKNTAVDKNGDDPPLSENKPASTKSSEDISSKDTQLKQHAAEIDQLKAAQDAHYLEIDKLDSELDTANREYEVLEEKNEGLFNALQQSELRNNTLQIELDNANSAIDAQYNAVKSFASEVSIDITVNMTFNQILDAIKGAYHARRASSMSEATKSSERIRALERELSEVRLQLRNSLPSDRMQTLQLEGTRQELSESRALTTVLQGEISRLSSKIESIISEQTKLQDTLYKTTQERDKALYTIENLRNQQDMTQSQQLSPPVSPALQPSGLGTSKCPVDHDALLRSHEAELNSVHSAHATALSTLRDSHTETIRTLQNVISASQSRETKLNSDLSALRTSLVSLEQRVAGLHAERERLESIIEAKESAAKAIDKKFAGVLKKREEVWEGRVEGLLKDRERMGKILMWTWGKEEVGGRADAGDGMLSGHGKENKPPQGYKYKYVERRGGKGRDV
ncbi:hypothetical protein RJZ56_000661 [Blastomyces dermatitidis]|uniref:SNAD protein n=1 Tax=Blastomyces gilchristii (strain SLH14081) TaxID=559298 RepID=A0A179UC14_BLAGS|nr:SNAD protein [Blastomyces gilchristii SLH14081]OAT04829.1 SNAD protein [Blastomyces gilchristii SLH14081]